jgi:hypothetical protein
MNHLEPRESHPLLWALEDIIGLTLDQISAGVDISRSVLVRIREGRTPKRDQVVGLAAFVRKYADRIARDMSPAPMFTRKLPEPPFRYWHRSPELYEWRRATFNMLNQLIKIYTHPAITPPTKSTLGHELIAVVGRGKDRDLIFSHFRSTQRGHLRKLAKRIGIREQRKDDVVYWLPPEDLPNISNLKLPEPAPHFKRTPRSLAIQNALWSFLHDYPDGVDSKEAVAYVMRRAKTSRPAVFRAARDLCIVREMSGFGPTKKSMWRLPPPAPKKEVES